MRSLIIHVGFGKTGTSAIQRALQINAEKLRTEGIFCCDLWLTKRLVGERGFASPAEFLQVLNSGPQRFADRLKEIFDPGNPCFGNMRTVIWSNEALAMHWAPLGTFTDGYAGREQLKIILYLRNQVDWLISAYLQWSIKDKQSYGKVRNWNRFKGESRNSTDYLTVAEGWKKSCKDAALFLRSYDAVKNVVEDFFEVAGITAELDGTAERFYETPSYTAHALFKILNDQFEEPRGPEPLLSLLEEAGVLSRDLHSVDPCPLDVTPEVLEEVAQSFSEMNDRLEIEYGVKLNPSAKRSAIVGRRPQTVEANTDIIAALLMMIIRLDQKLRALQGTVRELQLTVQAQNQKH